MGLTIYDRGTRNRGTSSQTLSDTKSLKCGTNHNSSWMICQGDSDRLSSRSKRSGSEQFCFPWFLRSLTGSISYFSMLGYNLLHYKHFKLKSVLGLEVDSNKFTLQVCHPMSTGIMISIRMGQASTYECSFSRESTHFRFALCHSVSPYYVQS